MQAKLVIIISFIIFSLKVYAVNLTVGHYSCSQTFNLYNVEQINSALRSYPKMNFQLKTAEFDPNGDLIIALPDSANQYDNNYSVKKIKFFLMENLNAVSNVILVLTNKLGQTLEVDAEYFDIDFSSLVSLAREEESDTRP